MAISNLNQMLAGFQQMQLIAKSNTPTMVVGRPQSLWGVAGIPGAGSYDTTLNGVVRSSTSALVTGQIPHNDGTAGVNSYLARFQGEVTVANSGVLYLCDRLWENGGITITSTSLQSITSPTWPSRDSNGLTFGTSVMLAVEVSAATGAGTPTLTIGYTNSAGASGATATNLDLTGASSNAGSFYRMNLAQGDLGVRSVQSITLSATWTSGTINIVAYRVLALLELTGSILAAALDPVTSGVPQLFNGVVPFLVYVPTAVTAAGFNCTYTETQG